MPNSLENFTLVLIMASGLGFAVKLLRQPIIIAYVLTGLLLSVASFFGIAPESNFGFLPEVGVAFLVFMLGMELDFRELRRVGRTVLFGATIYVLLLISIGFLMGRVLGFSLYEAVVLGFAISFSSTVLVVKFLSDRKELASLHGKISIGILLVEDILAILVLFVMGFLSKGGGFDSVGILDLLIKLSSLATLYFFAVFLSKDVLPVVYSKISENGELILISSISLCLLFVILSQLMGVSVSIGAFLAGFSLASEPIKYLISTRLRSIKDLFIGLFFIDAASKLSFVSLSNVFLPFLIIVIFVVFIKPYVIYLSLVLMGEKKRVAFLSALPMGQISEFSVIISTIALSFGLVGDNFLSLIILAFALSMILSSAFGVKSKELFTKIGSWGLFFERRTSSQRHENIKEMKDHVVLIGCDKLGEVVLNYLIKSSEDFVVVDFNPDVISKLKTRGVKCVLGDIEDNETMEKVYASEAKLIVSTIPVPFSNMVILQYLNKCGFGGAFFVVSMAASDVSGLYENGAAYVVVPDTISGSYVVSLVGKFLSGEIDKEKMKRYQGEEIL